jgi:hypothetical protein
MAGGNKNKHIERKSNQHMKNGGYMEKRKMNCS